METERIILRRFMLSDVNQCYHNFGQDASIGKYIAGYPMKSLCEMENMIKGFCGNENIWLIQEKLSQSPMGYISVDIPYETLGIGEIGFVLGENFQKKGYGREAVELILKYLFDQKQMYMIEAKVNEYNYSSGNLLNRLGFKKDAILRNRRITLNNGKRCDVLVYSITNEEYNSRELWDLYTKYREKTGEVQVRGAELPNEKYHLVVDVWVKNSKGQYLISKRSLNRKNYPLKWACPGGGVISGEDSLTAALREVKEEVGVELNRNNGKLLFSKIHKMIDGKKINNIMDVWQFEYDGPINLKSATTDEVVECKWMEIKEIDKLYDSGEFVDVLGYYKYILEADEPDYRSILGKKVSGIIDRKMGSAHPRHADIIYEVNYGYVEGVFAGDGEEQDVYVFGVDEPIDKFTGKVIGVYHRFNDVEDKWIVYAGKDGEEPSNERILGDISFQEQYFVGKLYG